MNRQEKQELHKKLIDLLLENTTDDTDFFNRLIYSLYIISNELKNFEEKKKDGKNVL